MLGIKCNKKFWGVLLVFLLRIRGLHLQPTNATKNFWGVLVVLDNSEKECESWNSNCFLGRCADVIRSMLETARQMASPTVPEVWLHRRNWDFAIKFLPKEHRTLGQEAIRIATFGMDTVFEGNVEDLPRNVKNCVRTEEELVYVDCDFIEELWRGRRRVGA